MAKANKKQPVTKKKPSAGAPTKYKPEYNEQAYKLCLLGATDEEIADFFEVHVDSIYEWKKVYPTFSEAVKRGKKIADAEVANSLYNRAKGFEIESEKLFSYEGHIIRADTKTYFPPDAGAAMNWLKNRQPDKWREKTEVEVTGELQVIKVGYGKDKDSDEAEAD